MCGIAGILNATGTPVARELLLKMTQIQAHRGPDDEGIYFDPRGGVGLGHRRLSIIDLSAAGHQPLCYAGRYWITYNGEVYNYIELRAELQQAGYRFNTQTDTEVILAAYAHWGTDCLRRFNGMWALAIWDAQERKLFCARDRWGIKPFFYTETSGWFVFASEIKALNAFLSSINAPVRPDNNTVGLYLWNLAIDRYEATFYEGIKRLLPGHVLEWQNGRVRLHRWYQLEPGRECEFNSFDEASKAWGELFRDSIKLMLRSDVPVGSCLSGGMDSSAIVSVMAEQLAVTGKRPYTFSACYEGHAEIDERPYMKAVAEQTHAQAFEVWPTADGLEEDLTSFLAQQDEPVGSTSMYAQYCVFRTAREAGVTVMLDGQGADETLTGYTGGFDRQVLSLILRGRFGQAQRLIGVLAQRYQRSPLGEWRKALMGVGGWVWPAASQRFRHKQRAPGLVRILPDVPADQDPLWRAWRKTDPLHFYLYNSTAGSSLQSLLRYEDRNSMAFSLEARVPFLDYRLVELAFSLPGNWLLHGAQTKAVMRTALRNVIPEKVLSRKDKIGFATPEYAWAIQFGQRLMPALLRENLPAWQWVMHDQAAALADTIRALPPAYSRDDGKLFWGKINRFWRVLNIAHWSRQFT